MYSVYIRVSTDIAKEDVESYVYSKLKVKKGSKSSYIPVTGIMPMSRDYLGDWIVNVATIHKQKVLKVLWPDINIVGMFDIDTNEEIVPFDSEISFYQTPKYNRVGGQVESKEVASIDTIHKFE